MKTTFLMIAWMICALVSAHAQVADSVYYQKPAPSMVPLRPIESSMGKFYYGGKRLNSAFSLEIPFTELNDEQVNRTFKRYRTARLASGVVGFAPLVYILLNARSGFSRDTYWIVFGATVVTSFGLNIYGDSQARRAVNLYNARLGSRRVGFSIQSLPNGRLAPGLGYAARF
jgi:hypothetical protein